MTATIHPHPAICYRRPFRTVDAVHALSQIAIQRTSTPEAARAACLTLADLAECQDICDFWMRRTRCYGYSQGMHQ